MDKKRTYLNLYDLIPAFLCFSVAVACSFADGAPPADPQHAECLTIFVPTTMLKGLDGTLQVLVQLRVANKSKLVGSRVLTIDGNTDSVATRVGEDNLDEVESRPIETGGFALFISSLNDEDHSKKFYSGGLQSGYVTSAIQCGLNFLPDRILYHMDRPGHLTLQAVLRQNNIFLRSQSVVLDVLAK